MKDAGSTWRPAGKVRSVHVPRRELRVTPLPDAARALDEAQWVRVAVAGESEPVRCKVAGVRWHANEALVALGPGVSRDLVGRMRRAEVLVPEQALEAATEDGWTLTEIEGYDVIDAERGPVGRIAGGFETPAALILEVTGPDGTEWLVPAVEELIDGVDDAARAVRVHGIDAFAARQDAPGAKNRAD